MSVPSILPFLIQPIAIYSFYCSHIEDVTCFAFSEAISAKGSVIHCHLNVVNNR